MEKRKKYIAYGSNLNLEQMAFRCPTAKVVGKSELKDYELLFRGGRRGAVALQAAIRLLYELRLSGVGLVERVEDGAKLRVGDGDLDHFATLAKADVAVVVEIHRSWRAGRDPVALHARL